MVSELGGSQISSLLETLPGIANVLRSPVADALVGVMRAGAGLTEFRYDDADELVKYAVRRGLMNGDEGDRLLAELREVSEPGTGKTGRPAERPKPVAAPASEAPSPAVSLVKPIAPVKGKVAPARPAAVARPAKSAKPVKLARPVKPAKSARPAPKPAKKAKPVKAAKSARTSRPTKPVRAAKPVRGSKGARTAKKSAKSAKSARKR